MQLSISSVTVLVIAGKFNIKNYTKMENDMSW